MLMNLVSLDFLFNKISVDIWFVYFYQGLTPQFVCWPIAVQNQSEFGHFLSRAITTQIEFGHSQIEGKIYQFLCHWNPLIVSFLCISDLLDLDIIWSVNLRILTETFISVIYYPLILEKSQ